MCGTGDGYWFYWMLCVYFFLAVYWLQSKGGWAYLGLIGCSTNSIILRILARKGEKWNIKCFFEWSKNFRSWEGLASTLFVSTVAAFGGGGAITKKRYTRCGFSQKRVHPKTKSKTHPTSHHATDLSKAYRTRLLALFWGTMTHRYTCWRLFIYFDVSRFSLDGSSPAGIRSE